VLVIIGALFSRFGAMAPVLWVLAVLSTVTIIHRIIYTYQQTRILDEAAEAAKAAQEASAAAAPAVMAAPEAGKPQPAQEQRPIASFN
jgi:CDP-diacylglycerol---glycerol-3-phosphate 3-phosphatidyltransferase